MEDTHLEPSSRLVVELISSLKSAFESSDFQKTAKKLADHEQTLKKNNNELLKKNESLEKENALLVKKNQELNGLLKKKEKEMADELKKKDNEVEEMKKKVKVWEKKLLDFGVRVSSLEKLGKEFKDSRDCLGSVGLEEKKQKKGAAESSRPPPGFKEKGNSKKNDVAAESSRPPPGFKEKVDPKKRTEPKFSDIIEIDDDDDDIKHISSSKRKQGLNEIKKEDNSDDDYNVCISVLTRKHATKKAKRVSDDEIVNISKGTQPITSRPLSTPHSAKISPFYDSADDEKGKKVYNSTCAKKKQKERWESKDDMVNEFDKDNELCLNAVCALHRQKIILRSIDVLRITTLARQLIDGDPEKRLNKTASKLEDFDLKQCRMFANDYAAELFEIYRKKSDPFFPS